MPIAPLLVFAALYVFSKAMEKRVPFYAAAMLFIASLYIVNLIVSGFQTADFSLGELPLRFILAMVLFYGLDRYEETMSTWLTIFIGGFVTFAFLLG